MRTIHKWVLQPGLTVVPTYERACVLHVATQNEVPCIWAEVNTLERECFRRFVAVGTGFEVPEHATYLGTAIDVEGALVFHIYEHLS